MLPRNGETRPIKPSITKKSTESEDLKTTLPFAEESNGSGALARGSPWVASELAVFLVNLVSFSFVESD